MCRACWVLERGRGLAKQLLPVHLSMAFESKASSGGMADEESPHVASTAWLLDYRQQW